MTSEPKRVIITYVDKGIKLEHNFDDVGELALASLTFVRGIGERLKSDPPAHQYYVTAITQAAREGGVTEEQAQ